MKRIFLCQGLFLIVSLLGPSTTALAQGEPENPFGYRMGLLKENAPARSFAQKVESIAPALYAPDVSRGMTVFINQAGIPPIGDQGQQGSCTAWAMAYYHRTHSEWKEQGWNVADPAHQFSPAFVYNHINGGRDWGSYEADAARMMLDHGCATMAEMPYSDANWFRWPDEDVYRNALQYRTREAHYIDISSSAGVNTLKQHLANGNTAVIAINCYANFYLIHEHGYNYCLADVTSQNYGAHALCVIGYNDSRSTRDGMGAVRIANSWGVGWGDNGYFWMSYAALMSRVTSYQEAVYLTDRIGYTPRLVADVNIDHMRRGQIIGNNGLILGVGHDWSQAFFSFPYMEYYYAYFGEQYQPRPFPGTIPIDLTDGLGVLEDRRLFLEVQDCVPGEMGSIESFTAYLVDDDTTGISPDVSVDIPDSCTKIMAALYLGGETRTIGPGLDYETITAALADSSAGDRLLIASGTYSSVSGEVFPLPLMGSINLRPLVPGSSVNIIGVPGASIFTATDIPPESAPELIGLSLRGGGGTLSEDRRYGGAFYVDSAAIRVRACSIGECSADLGGAAYAVNGAAIEMRNCSLFGNSAKSGGAISSDSSSIVLRSVLLYSNTADEYGGAVQASGGTTQLFNCTLTGNTAGISGGGLHQTGGSGSLSNSIFWENAAPSDPQIGAVGGTVTCTYSCVQGGWTGADNITQNPLFKDPSAQDYHLQFGSPCKDAGNPDSAWNDASRPPGIGTARNDMGAYGGPDNRDWLPEKVLVTVGHGEEFNFTSISEAMSCASSGFTILVEDGTYSAATGEVFPIVLKPRVILKRADENTHPVIQGVSTASVFRGYSIRSDAASVVDGFRITGGGGTPSYSYQNGGAFHLSRANPEIRNCIITGNSLASGYGGGVYAAERSSAQLIKCSITGNYAGGTYGSGGGVYCHGDSNIVMIDCIVTGNTATHRGGGICAANYTRTFYTNCLIANNSCGGDGGGLYTVTSAKPYLMNCTIVNNTSSTRGGGLHIQYLSAVDVTNCIVWGNTAPQASQISLVNNSTAKVGYSCVQDGWEGTGNISGNPLFVNPAALNYRLQYGSPCIDSATSAGAPSVDLDGDPRPLGYGYDMGVYEYPGGPPPSPTPTGTPTHTPTPTATPFPDCDGDGITDSLEGNKACGPGRSNMYLPDSDGDGLWDGIEDANRNGTHLDSGETDPRNRDTDGDGYEDGIEVLLLASSPLHPNDPVEPFGDSDGDGLPDSIDPNPNAPDTDGDRFLDGYEAAVFGLSGVTDANVKPGLGDVNHNEFWDNADAQLILNFFAYQPTVPGFDFTRTDLERNGTIDNADAQHSLNFFGRATEYLPVR